MKKKIIAFLCAMAFLAVAIPAQAQLRFGVKGGLNITSVHFDSDLLKSDNVTGFHILVSTRRSFIHKKEWKAALLA